MTINKTSVFIICLLYLVALSFLLDAMSVTIVSMNNQYTETSQSLGFHLDFLGMNIGLGDSFLGNIVISIALLPIWANTLFIVIPSILCIVYGIAQFIPTVPSG